jgi:hypothetical protein
VSDRVLIPLAGVGTLAMSREDYDAALEAGRELSRVDASPRSPTPTAPLYVDASEVARLTNTAASWWEAAARDLDCPSVFVGRLRRFKVADCLAWLEAVQERDGGGHIRRCGAAPRARS